MEASGIQQLLLQSVRELSAEVAELKENGAAPLTDNIAHWLAAQFLVAAKKAAQEAEGGCMDLKTLGALNADVVALRRGDHSAERLKVEREWLDLETEKFQFDAARLAKDHAKTIKLICSDKSLNEKEMIEKIRFRLFGAASENMQEVYHSKPPTPEQREERMRSVFGLRTLPQDAPAHQTSDQ